MRSDTDEQVEELGGVDTGIFGGVVTKRGRGRLLSFFRPWSQRYITLNINDGVLNYYAHKSDIAERKEKRGSVNIKNSVLEIRESDLSIDVVLSVGDSGVEDEDEEVFTLKFASLTTLRSWFPLFRTAVTGERVEREGPLCAAVDKSTGLTRSLDATSRNMIETVVRSAEDIFIELMEHQHTLFCERKQRVCTAVGKAQEMEKLKVVFLPKTILSSNIVWTRCDSLDSSSSSSVIVASSEGHMEYTLERDDIGNYICAKSEDGRVSNLIGPVLAGPPRLKDLRIEVVGGGGFFQFDSTGEEQILCFQPGTVLVAKAEYIGGHEGDSEYWWLRIRGGKREQIGSPRPLSSIPDPKFYIVTEEDIGCEFKVKVTPVRSDGAKGEVFTSKSSGLVVSSACCS